MAGRDLEGPPTVDRATRIAASMIVVSALAYGQPASGASAQGSRRARPGVSDLGSAGARDVGEIAVLADEGDLVLLRNLMDLGGVGIEFRPVAGGYILSRVDRPVAPEPGGTRLQMGDESTVSAALPFVFPFYGKTYNRVYVNSDGNVTFGSGDGTSGGSSLRRLLVGPPRIAGFFTDLDPSRTGTIAVYGDAAHFSITWTAVPQFAQMDKNTFQIALYPDGRITIAYDKELSSLVEEGVVGIAPGASQNGLVGTDLSAAAGVFGGGAIAEAFRARDALDEQAVARKFYRSHGDDYQQLIVFTSRPLDQQSGRFAYEITIRNGDSGIGSQIVDLGQSFGSAQRLESFVDMDFALKYPDDPAAVVSGAVSALSILAQQVAHRWGAFALFRDGAGTSDELLGVDGENWSFYMDTNASHLQGNAIQDLGGGFFKTVAAGERYSALDQYLMGIRPAAEVPPFFIVRDVVGTDPNRAQAPQVGVRFQGVRRDVTIDEIVAAIGPRNPAPGPRPPYRQAFVYVDAGNLDSGAPLALIDRIRTAWEPFFSASTDGRWAVDTRLAH